MSILVIDVGTSGVRAAAVTPDAEVTCEHYTETLPDSPMPGLVEFDATALADAAMDAARRSLADAGEGTVEAIGIANQRTSTIVWDRATGTPIGPGIGWQDLRTVGECLMLREQGIRVAPNHSATKLGWLLDQFDPERTQDLCFGTVDTWITWHLSAGDLHVTDRSNQSVSGLDDPNTADWNGAVLEALRVPEALLPTVVDSTGIVGVASALPGDLPIAGILGDQQASMVGQGCVEPGLAKITFGTGGMLDMCVGTERPSFEQRGDGGTFALVGWQAGGAATWAIEGIMLSAGTNVEWLRDDLAIIATAAESHNVASQCDDTDGVVYVPALLGLGTPQWDYGARGALFGVTRGTARPQVVRAVLEGVAHRGADLVEAAETDSSVELASLRVDGGMSTNPTFIQALADASGRTVEVSPVADATTLGAAFAAGLAIGTWSGWSDIATTWEPSHRVEPQRQLDRDRWHRAVERSTDWFPELSTLDF